MKNQPLMASEITDQIICDVLGWQYLVTPAKANLADWGIPLEKAVSDPMKLFEPTKNLSDAYILELLITMDGCCFTYEQDKTEMHVIVEKPGKVINKRLFVGSEILDHHYIADKNARCRLTCLAFANVAPLIKLPARDNTLFFENLIYG